jgi:hypothetical protein
MRCGNLRAGAAPDRRDAIAAATVEMVLRPSNTGLDSRLPHRKSGEIAYL